MRRRVRPVSDLPEKFECFQLASWWNEAADRPPPPYFRDGATSRRENEFLWHAVRAIRRYLDAKQAWLRARNAPVTDAGRRVILPESISLERPVEVVDMREGV